ncbi:hypothetical protein GCM10020331_066410 [Ectobacillus funiculus]
MIMKNWKKVLMKTEGLGTEATRAGIITMLKDRKYIEVTKKIRYMQQIKEKVLIEAIGNKNFGIPRNDSKVGTAAC